MHTMFSDLRCEDYHRFPPYDLYRLGHDVVLEDSDNVPSSSSHLAFPKQRRLLYSPSFEASSAIYDCPDCTNPFYSNYQSFHQDVCFGPMSSEDCVADGISESASTSSRKSSSSSSKKKSLSQDELERRRSVANHQERRRMHRLNSALDLLRSVIPLRMQNGNHRRLSKIKTLKMAIMYIAELQKMLGRPVVA